MFVQPRPPAHCMGRFFQRLTQAILLFLLLFGSLGTAQVHAEPIITGDAAADFTAEDVIIGNKRKNGPNLIRQLTRQPDVGWLPLLNVRPCFDGKLGHNHPRARCFDNRAGFVNGNGRPKEPGSPQEQQQSSDCQNCERVLPSVAL